MADSRHDSDGREMPSQSVCVILLPEGRVALVSPGTTYAELLSTESHPVRADCGGMGTCGKCRIRFESSPPDVSAAGMRHLSTDEIAKGWRLACQQHVRDGAQIEWPENGLDELRSKATETFLDSQRDLRPEVAGEIIDLPPLRAKEGTPGADALARVLDGDFTITETARQGMADRSADVPTRCHVVRRGRQILDVQPALTKCSVLGAAIDVGTTTLAVYVFDLESGAMVARDSKYNPQRVFGADVISRIGVVRQNGNAGLTALQGAVVDGLNDLLAEACRSTGRSAESIYAATIVGNPTMLHLIAGISPVGIDHSPYVAAFLDSLEMRAAKLGLRIHPEANVLLLPSVSSYVGADIVAGVLATELGARGRAELLVDVGTNGEMALATDGQLICCSTAAGPAFEGATIRQGMNALAGAIESVRIEGETIQLRTIANAPPKGLCGTGLISAVHELCRSGFIGSTGRFEPAAGTLGQRLRGEGRTLHYVLTDGVPAISLYQQDVREFQLGKAAIRAGIDTLLDRAGKRASDLDRLYVAGAFGTHLEPRHAIGTGLLPPMDEERVEAVGNTAGRGAVLVLLNHLLRSEAERIAKQAEYVELSTASDFADRYIDQMAFPAE